MATASSGIAVEAHCPILNVPLRLNTPYVQIDGREHKLSWGANTIPTTPGKHNVRCFLRSPIGIESLSSNVELDVPEGKVTKIRFAVPTFLWDYMTNRITVVGTGAG
jgi:hypothetical protein